MSGLRFYNPEDSEEILRLAGARAVYNDSLSHVDLVKAAAELGISESVVVEAEKARRIERFDARDRAEFKRHKIRQLGYGILWEILVLSIAFSMTHISSMAGIFMVAVATIGVSAMGLIFSRSMQYETEFRSWLSIRKMKTQLRNGEGLQVLMRVRYESGDYRTKADLLRYLVVERKMDPGEAEEALLIFTRLYPSLPLADGPKSKGS